MTIGKTDIICLWIKFIVQPFVVHDFSFGNFRLSFSSKSFKPGEICTHYFWEVIEMVRIFQIVCKFNL